MDLQCRECRRPGRPGESRCAQCDLYLLIPDPDPPNIPAANLGDKFHSLWELSKAVARGREHGAALEAPIMRMLLAFRQMRQEVPMSAEQAGYLDSTMQALERIRRFADSLEVADINQGWLQLIPSAERVLQTAKAMSGAAAVPVPDTAVADDEPVSHRAMASIEWILSEEAQELGPEPEW